MGIKDSFVSLAGKIRTWVKKNPVPATLMLVAAVVLSIVLTVQILHYTSTPDFCRNCHPKQSGFGGEVATWEKSKHASAGVSCLDCHARPGFVGYMTTKVSAMSDVYHELFSSKDHKMHILMKSSDPVYAAKLVKNDQCMFCHTDSMNKKIRSENLMSLGHAFRKLDGVVNPEFRKSVGLPDILVDGVRPATDVDPKHSKHYEMGFNCVDCHQNITHSGTLGYRSSMPICFKCHDIKRKEGKQPPADSNCTACHRNSDRVTPKKAILFGKGETLVNFNHTTHTKGVKCDSCHTQRFPMQAGKTKVTFNDHGKNTACFSCHNGKQAPDWMNCTTCHTKMSKPKPMVFGKGSTAVTFKHDTHTVKNKCTDCHNSIFAMKSASAKITLSDHGNNKACFSCHNGKKASSWTNCTTCHSKAPTPKNITYKPADVDPVTFSHESHVGNFECKDCHTKIWPMKRGAPMKMDPMYEGGSCGTCHSDKGGAFAATDCNKCHIPPKK